MQFFSPNKSLLWDFSLVKPSDRIITDDFCPRRNLNSVEDYSSSVGVVCRVSNLKDGTFSKRFELESWNFVWSFLMTWQARFNSREKIGPAGGTFHPPQPPQPPGNSNFKHGIISKRFELEGWNFVWSFLMTWQARFSSRKKIGPPQPPPTPLPPPKTGSKG